MGIYFSQISALYFCWDFSCCLCYRGVHNSEVSARRELTLNINIIIIIFEMFDCSFM